MGCGFGYVYPTKDGGVKGGYVGWGRLKGEKVEIESKPPIQIGEVSPGR